MSIPRAPWHQYARRVARVKGRTRIVAGKLVTLACERHLRDLERQIQGATKVPTSGFAQAIIKHMS